MIAVAIAIVAVAVAATIAIGSALKGIFTAAVYRYAADSAMDGVFRPDLVQQAFRPKR